MILGEWRRWKNNLSRKARDRKSVRSARPRFEVLEGREVPAVIFVDNLSDYTITTDQGAIGLDSGDIVTWNPGAGSAHGGPVQNLTFGTQAFSSIQAAIDAASAGDTVRVGSGTFAEKVTVSKQLTLLGNQFDVDARNIRGAESVVTGVGNSGFTPFYLTANNVTLNGFTVEGATSSNAFGYGILLAKGTSGAQVLNNIIQDNIIGLGLANNPTGDPALIQHNLFRNNNANGPAGGTGIYTDPYVGGPTMANVTIDANTFDNHRTMAVNLNGQAQSNITISDNTMTGNGQAVRLVNTTASSIDGNTITGSTKGSQVVIGGGVNGLSISENFIQNGAYRGIQIAKFSGFGTNQNVTIFNNNISGNALAGLEIYSIPAGTYTGTLNASGNWWGAATGPTMASNPGGAGSSIIDPAGQVDYSPWLSTGTDTDLLTPGFQGDFSKLTVNASSLRHTGQITGNLQEGIDEVTTGGTVTAMAGTYNELVSLNKAVTMAGAQAGVDARTRTGVAESIVSNASGAFVISADNVTIDGFTIRDVDASGLTAGVHAVGVSNFNILNNIITNNAIGIFARPTGASLIQHNLFDANNTFASGGMSAIYSEGSVDLTVDSNAFINHTGGQGSIVRFVGPDKVSTVNHTNLTFTNNLLDDNGSGVFAMTVSRGLFQGNTISTAGAGTALNLGEAVTDVDVLNNIFTDNLRGLRVQEFGFVDGDNPSSNIEVHSNDLSGNTEYGLGIVGAGFTGKLDASGNWWGASTAAGVAAETSGNVDFMPFLVTGVDTDPLAAGFQGDATVAPGQGSVRVMVVGGRLTIIGDRRDNLITVEKGPEANSYRVTGLAGTQINGLSGSFDFKNVTKGIDARLGGGNDMLVLDGSASPFTVLGTVKVLAGNGDDLVRFEDVTVDGQTVVRGGNGADSVQAVNSVLDAALIRTGFGNDTVRVEGVHAKGRVQVETGRHTDMVAVSDSIFKAAVVFDGGYGNDNIDVATPGNDFDIEPVIRGF